MSLRFDAAAALRDEITRLAEAAARKTLAGKSVTLEMDRIALLQRVLDVLPPSRDRTFLWAILVASVCVAAVTASVIVRIPQTRVELEVRTRSLSFRLAEPIQWNGVWQVDPHLVSFRNVEHAELPPEFDPPAWTERVSVDVTAANGIAKIRALAAEAGATVALDQAGKPILITVARAPAQVVLDVTGQVTVTAKPDWRSSPVSFEQPPGELVVSGPGKGEVPAALRVTPLDMLELRDIQISSLGFLHEQVDARQRRIDSSGVESGSLLLTDTGEKIVLLNEAMLRLEEATGTITSLRVAPNGVTLRFEGTAHDLTLGRGNFLRELRPTLLDYLFHQQTVGFVWGGLTFLSGLLWSVRRLLLDRR